MKPVVLSLLSSTLLTGVWGIAAETAAEPEKKAPAMERSMPQQEKEKQNFRRGGRGFGGGRAFAINYGYNEAEQKIIAAEEAKIRQAVLGYRKEKNDANLKAVENQVAASLEVILPIRQAAAARMEEGRSKQMAQRMLEMQLNSPERSRKMMLQQALYPPKPVAPQMDLTEEQQSAIREWDQKVRQAAAAYHAEKKEADLNALKKTVTDAFDQVLKIRTDAVNAMKDGEAKTKAKQFLETATKERDLQIEDEYERLQHQFRQRIMRRGEGGFRGEGGRRGGGGFRGPRGGGAE